MATRSRQPSERVLGVAVVSARVYVADVEQGRAVLDMLCVSVEEPVDSVLVALLCGRVQVEVGQEWRLWGLRDTCVDGRKRKATLGYAIGRVLGIEMLCGKADPGQGRAILEMLFARVG